MLQDWTAVDTNTKVAVWPVEVQPMLNTLLSLSEGTDDPKTGLPGGGDTYAVSSTLWSDLNDEGGFKYVRQLGTDGSTWNKLWERDADFGSLLNVRGLNRMVGNLRLNNNVRITFDADENTYFVSAASGVVSMFSETVEVLKAGEIQNGAPQLDLMGLLRLSRPQGMVLSGTSETPAGGFPVGYDASGNVVWVNLFSDAPD